MNEYKTKFEEAQRCINDFNMQKAKLQTENGTFCTFLQTDIYLMYVITDNLYTKSFKLSKQEKSLGVSEKNRFSLKLLVIEEFLGHRQLIQNKIFCIFQNTR